MGAAKSGGGGGNYLKGGKIQNQGGGSTKIGGLRLPGEAIGGGRRKIEEADAIGGGTIIAMARESRGGN